MWLTVFDAKVSTAIKMGTHNDTYTYGCQCKNADCLDVLDESGFKEVAVERAHTVAATSTTFRSRWLGHAKGSEHDCQPRRSTPLVTTFPDAGCPQRYFGRPSLMLSHLECDLLITTFQQDISPHQRASTRSKAHGRLSPICSWSKRRWRGRSSALRVCSVGRVLLVRNSTASALLCTTPALKRQ